MRRTDVEINQLSRVAEQAISVVELLKHSVQSTSITQSKEGSSKWLEEQVYKHALEYLQCHFSGDRN